VLLPGLGVERLITMTSENMIGLEYIRKALDEAVSIVVVTPTISLIHKKALEAVITCSLGLSLSGLRNERFDSGIPPYVPLVLSTILKYSNGVMDLRISMKGITFSFTDLPLKDRDKPLEEYCAITSNPIVPTFSFPKVP
jgi:hypothetical protein